MNQLSSIFSGGRGGSAKTKTEDQVQVLVDVPSYDGKPLKRAPSQLAAATKDDPRHVSRVLFCFVLPVNPTKKKPYKTQEDVDKWRQDLVTGLVGAGLGVSLFYSVQGDEVLIKVSATDARLLDEADLCQHTLQLDPDSMRTVAQSAADAPNRMPIFLEPPFDPQSEFLYRTTLGQIGLGDEWAKLEPSEIDQYMPFHNNPFEHLHARYNDQWERHHLEKNKVEIYRTYSDGSILRTADRIRLIQIIIERSRRPDPSHHNKGAGYNLQKIALSKHVLAAFPYTPAATLPPAEPSPEALYLEWNSIRKLPWTQPLDDIRDYFGEAIALYFAFLGHYTKWLFFAGVIGLAVFIHQLQNIQQGTGVANFFSSTRFVNATNPITGQHNKTSSYVVAYSEVPETPFFALFMAFWSTFMIEYWKRYQARLVLRWGTSNFEALEVVRPEFIASHVLPSPVTGRPELYYSPNVFRAKIQAGLAVVFSCIMIVVATIAAIFVFKVFLSLPDANTGLDQETSQYLALVVNVVAIQTLAAAFRFIAKTLNDWENYRTDTQYNDALILKTFIFSFCNSYATLFYISYIKSGTSILGQLQACESQVVNPATNERLGEDACFGSIGTSLLIVFVLSIVLNNTLEIVVPSITGFVRRYLNLAVKAVAGEEKKIILRSPAEDEYFKGAYEGTFGDFLEMALQFGYVTLFVAAFPMAPFLAFINNVIEVRVDSYKVCMLSRRTYNIGAQDIGSWQGILNFMALASVVSNSAIIFFTSKSVGVPPGVNISEDAFRVWMFILSSALVLGVKYLIDLLTPDVPADVAIQLKRQEFLVRKCLALEPDSEDEDDDDKAQNQAAADVKYVINDHDPYVETVLNAIAESILRDSSFNPDEAFKRADRNKNGVISKDEFKHLLRSIDGITQRVTPEEVDMIAEALDANGNNSIDYQEFIQFLQRSKQQGQHA